jgi:hypothetical protein
MMATHEASQGRTELLHLALGGPIRSRRVKPRRLHAAEDPGCPSTSLDLNESARVHRADVLGARRRRRQVERLDRHFLGGEGEDEIM